MTAASLTFLAIICVVCLLGVFSHKFADNWLQFFGLCGVTLWAGARFAQVLDGAYISPQQLLIHGSLASFAIGTAHKVWRNSQPKPPKPPAPYNIEQSHLKHVVGGVKK